MAARAAAFDQLGMQVTPANVLGIYSVVMEEAMRLQSSVQTFRTGYGLGMAPLGEDPVSPHAAQGFTEASGQLVAKCLSAVDDLKQVGECLAEAARAYGINEREVATAFNLKQVMYDPAPVAPLQGGHS